MAVIRIPQHIYVQAYRHMFEKRGEHFAFFLSHESRSQGEPVFLVHDVILIPDDELTFEYGGMVLSDTGILSVVNAAIQSNSCLIEAHNHGGKMPRFSRTDRRGFEEFPPYIHDSLEGRPYAATVWGDTTVYGEYFLANGDVGVIQRITVVGDQLQQVVSRHDDENDVGSVFNRQRVWFTDHGQRQLARFKVAVVGCGGTGAHVIQNLVYLGCRDFLLIDDDHVDETNMNRLVTANYADVGTPKVVLGRRMVKSVAPNSKVHVFHRPLQNAEVLDVIKGADVLFGCVDNDGARLILNEIAVAYTIPYFDVAVGIEADKGTVPIAGGRLAVVLPEGPCLNCMGEIDIEEASYFLAPSEEQYERVERGYVTGMDVPAPSVVSMNAHLASLLVNEFAIYISGLRPVHPLSVYDLLGSGRPIKSQWTVPEKTKRKSSCVTCQQAGIGDNVGLERFLTNRIDNPVAR